MTQTRKIYRDAGTGRLVSKDYAEANPATTVSETVELAEKPDCAFLPEEPAVKDGEGESV